MPSDICFDILLLTYNRPVLLKYTLQSLSNQTFKNFVIHLIDHGSNPPVVKENLPKDLNIRFTRYETNFVDQHGCDIQEKVLGQLEGTHFISLGDDDILLPHALETIESLLIEKPEIESLGVGFTCFNHDEGLALNNDDSLKIFDNRLYYFNAFETTISICCNWGIGAKVDYFFPEMAHPSASIISNKLIKKTTKKQGRLFIKPLGDVGYLGTLLNTDFSYFLNCPLVILGKSSFQETNSNNPNSRFKWERETTNIKYSPLRSSTFTNVAIESHLAVLLANGVDKRLDCSLRPEFFMRHLYEIISDDPWTLKTEQDVAEAMPFYIRSIIKYNGVNEAEARNESLGWLRKNVENIRNNRISKNNKTTIEVNNVCEYKTVLDYSEHLVDSYWRNVGL
ncbi:MAG: glycosyltransferase family 2 protein [Bacteroidetes bacterium]|nr:glycosyltransferase family 2 protein [Bacteroidota bacterium]